MMKRKAGGLGGGGGGQSHNGTLHMHEEPELPEIPETDRIVVRNVLYAAWAMQQECCCVHHPARGENDEDDDHDDVNGKPNSTPDSEEDTIMMMPAGSDCIGWQVQTKRDGYLVLVSFGTFFNISLQDLQLISDVNPLRIDSIVVRNAETANNNNRQNTASSSISSSSSSSSSNNNTAATATSQGGGVGAVLAIKVLNQQQPVRITEAEVVRVRKRHRGFSFSSMLTNPFSSSSTSSCNSSSSSGNAKDKAPGNGRR